jgi:hypothetical protein
MTQALSKKVKTISGVIADMVNNEPRCYEKRIVFLTTMSLLVFSVLAFPPAHASGGVVQNTSGYSTSGTTKTVAFASSVTSGDVVVVAIANYNSGSSTVSSVTDSLGSSFTLPGAFPECNGFANACVWIYYATLASSGADTVTVTVGASSTVDDVYIFEVSGITASGATAGFGASGAGTSASISTLSTAFTSEGFLVSIVKTDFSDVYTPGSGFGLAAFPAGSQDNSRLQYSTGGVTSPTTFPMTIASPDTWTTVGVAFNQSAVSVPEFPIAYTLPVLFVMAAAIYVFFRTRIGRSGLGLPSAPRTSAMPWPL